MKKNISNEKADYEQWAPQFVLIGLLNRFSNRYQAVADSFFNELSWKQTFLLNAITMFNEPPTMQELAEVMGCSHQNVNKICAKLLKDGYIEGVQDENDRRKQLLYLTDKATDFFNNNREGVEKSVTEIFKVINSDELKKAIDIMSRLTNRLEEIAEE